MEYCVYFALFLVVINLVITGIIYLVIRKNNENVSLSGIFAGVDGVLTLLAGAVVLVYSLFERSFGSAVLWGIYLCHFLPVAVVLFIASMIFYKVSKKDAKQQAQLMADYKNTPSEEFEKIADYSELLKLTNQLEHREIENLLAEQGDTD